MKKFSRIFFGGVLLIVCLANIFKDDEPKKSNRTNSVASWWKNYDPALKQRIDKSNCSQLQDEFNTAEANSDRQRARTGSGNLNLMSYIDDRMREKGCY